MSTADQKFSMNRKTLVKYQTYGVCLHESRLGLMLPLEYKDNPDSH